MGVLDSIAGILDGKSGIKGLKFRHVLAIDYGADSV